VNSIIWIAAGTAVVVAIIAFTWTSRRNHRQARPAAKTHSAEAAAVASSASPPGAAAHVASASGTRDPVHPSPEKLLHALALNDRDAGDPQFKPDPTAMQLLMSAGQDFTGDDLCDHYAFRQAGADWQIWIRTGGKPLPRKIVITNRSDDARPQSVSMIDWNLNPNFKEAAFRFTPPKGSSKIDIVPRKTQ
jgi:hypothetical protein